LNPKIKKAVKAGCTTLALVVLILTCVLVYAGTQFATDHYTIPGARRAINHTARQALGPEGVDVPIQSRSGDIIPAWFCPGNTRAAILLLHGLGGTREQLSPIAKRLDEQGWSVLLIDQRGHGQHPKNITTFGRAESLDALGAIDWLRSRDDVDPDRIGVYGASMGAVTCIHAAATDPDLACIVVDSAYAVFNDQIAFELDREGAGVKIPPRWRPLFIRIFKRFEPIVIGKWSETPDPVEDIRKIKCPVLLIHGELDQRIKPDNLVELADAARDAGVSVTTWLVPGERHCTYLNSDEFNRRLIAFFRQHL
jgi:dipeptidyl aminopeptidase/acylaminoacyl peptidase